jgi:hypothetical protein
MVRTRPSRSARRMPTATSIPTGSCCTATARIPCPQGHRHRRLAPCRRRDPAHTPRRRRNPRIRRHCTCRDRDRDLPPGPVRGTDQAWSAPYCEGWTLPTSGAGGGGHCRRRARLIDEGEGRGEWFRAVTRAGGACVPLPGPRSTYVLSQGAKPQRTLHVSDWCFIGD